MNASIRGGSGSAEEGPAGVEGFRGRYTERQCACCNMTDTKSSNGVGHGAGGPKQLPILQIPIIVDDRDSKQDGPNGTIRPKSPLKLGTPVFSMTKPNSSSELISGSSLLDEKLNSRDQEKMEVLAKQRENYLNSGTLVGGMDTELLVLPGTRNAGILKRTRLFVRDLFSEIDTHTEHLFYLIAVEMFFIFLTYTHYSYFDKKNRFLTPIVMGGETSLLGQTLSQLFDWTRTRTALRNRTLLRSLNDEEMNIAASPSAAVAVGGNSTTNSKSSGMREMHSRNSSNNTITSPLDPSLEQAHAHAQAHNHVHTLSQSNLLNADKDASLRDHLKFLTWGGVNGLLCSYWIELLLTIFKGRQIVCVLVDQSIGTVIFQTLYSLFICLWDGEIEVHGLAAGDTVLGDPRGHGQERRTVELTWDNFTNYYAGMLWKYMKLSYLMWPAISVLCFTVLSDEWIFPVNCFFSTLFGVTLGM